MVRLYGEIFELQFDDLDDAVQLDLELDALDGVDDPGAFAE